MQLTENLESESWVRESREKIRSPVSSDDPLFYGAVGSNREDKGTSHVSVLDKDGMAVAITTTINGQYMTNLKCLRIDEQCFRISHEEVLVVAQ